MPPSSKQAERFAERLRAARELRKMSQDEVARRAGLQASAVSHFETGTRKPSFDNLRRLADALEVTTDYLFGRVDDPTTSAPQGELYRKLGQLTATDRDVIKMFVDQLAKKNQGKKDKGEQ
jgi:transcriptional regulator with XRE-family HTH domain